MALCFGSESVDDVLKMKYTIQNSNELVFCLSIICSSIDTYLCNSSEGCIVEVFATI
jgi:hypothetical protein